jgi:hypothetical protein
VGGLGVSASAAWPPKAAAPISPFPTAPAIVQEHLDALNHCDWKRLMKQYSPDVELFLPGGKVIKGKDAVASLFHDMVKPLEQGGVCGVTFRSEYTLLVSNTVSVQWCATGGLLSKSYRGADAYITKDGLIAAQLTTFDRSQLK